MESFRGQGPLVEQDDSEHDSKGTIFRQRQLEAVIENNPIRPLKQRNRKKSDRGIPDLSQCCTNCFSWVMERGGRYCKPSEDGIGCAQCRSSELKYTCAKIPIGAHGISMQDFHMFQQFLKTRYEGISAQNNAHKEEILKRVTEYRWIQVRPARLLINAGSETPVRHLEKGPKDRNYGSVINAHHAIPYQDRNGACNTTLTLSTADVEKNRAKTRKRAVPPGTNDYIKRPRVDGGPQHEAESPRDSDQTIGSLGSDRHTLPQVCTIDYNKVLEALARIENELGSMNQRVGRIEFLQASLLADQTDGYPLQGQTPAQSHPPSYQTREFERGPLRRSPLVQFPHVHSDLEQSVQQDSSRLIQPQTTMFYFQGGESQHPFTFTHKDRPDYGHIYKQDPHIMRGAMNSTGALYSRRVNSQNSPRSSNLPVMYPITSQSNSHITLFRQVLNSSRVHEIEDKLVHR